MLNTIRILFAAAFLLLLTSCQQANHFDERASQKVVVIAVDRRPDNIDPRIGTSMASFRMQQLIYTPLIFQGPDGKEQPAAAAHWQVEKLQGQYPEQWTFHLRQDLYFHNEKQLTAADVVYTFQSLMHPDLISRKKAAFSAVAEVAAVDQFTVVFTMSQANSPLLSNLMAVGIVPAGSEPNGLDVPLGSGPFQLLDSSKQQYILDAFPRYFEGGPQIKQLRIKSIADDTTRALELLHGSVDLVLNDLNVRDAAYIGELERYQVVTAPGLTYQYVGFNHQHPILGQRRVREAIAHAINRKAIIAGLLGGLAQPASSVLLPVLWQGDVEFHQREFDPQLAARLLDEAGYKDPDGDGPEPRFSITMSCSNQKTSRDLVTVIRQQLAEVGIRLEVRSIEWQTFYADVVKGNVELYSMQWIGIIDPGFLGALFHSSSVPGAGESKRGTLNRGRFANKAVDTLIEKAEMEDDLAKRWQIYADIQKALEAELPYVDLWNRSNFAVIRKDLAGLQLSLNASFRYFAKLYYQP
jgi:peptide/nickel transport system substrate-binding protein